MTRCRAVKVQAQAEGCPFVQHPNTPHQAVQPAQRATLARLFDHERSQVRPPDHSATRNRRLRWLSRCGHSHESATLRERGGHFCGRVARSPIRQGLLLYTSATLARLFDHERSQTPPTLPYVYASGHRTRPRDRTMPRDRARVCLRSKVTALYSGPQCVNLCIVNPSETGVPLRAERSRVCAQQFLVRSFCLARVDLSEPSLSRWLSRSLARVFALSLSLALSLQGYLTDRKTHTLWTLP